MRFYNQAHQYYAGIDLHARTLYACVLDSDGDIRLHRADDTSAFYLLRPIPGIGKILAFTLFYEIHDIARFPKVGNFLSYARLVPGSRESDGKMKASGGRKMGNAHLKWAFSNAKASDLPPDGSWGLLFHGSTNNIQAGRPTRRALTVRWLSC